MSNNVRPRARRPRLARSCVLVALAAMLLLLAGLSGLATAVHDEQFELEGNTIANKDGELPGQPYDWRSFVGSDKLDPIPAGFSSPTFLPDHGADASAFTGGSKDSLPISKWSCKSASNVGPKFDILNTYSVAYDASGDLVAYTGVERRSNNGNANVGVWYLQDPTVSCSASGGGGTPFTGTHMENDVFVVSEFTDGGTLPEVKAYRWVGNGDGHLDPNPIASGGDCKTTTDNPADPEDDQICATVNTVPIETGWSSPDSDGDLLNERQFFEVGINLKKALNLSSTPCFATFLADTRSSQELGSTVHDFRTGSFQACSPGVSVTKTVKSVTYKYVLKNTGTGPALENPAVTDDKCTSPTLMSGDADSNGKLETTEEWVFECTMTWSATQAEGTLLEVTNRATGSGVFDPGGGVTPETITSTDDVKVGVSLLPLP